MHILKLPATALLRARTNRLPRAQQLASLGAELCLYSPQHGSELSSGARAVGLSPLPTWSAMHCARTSTSLMRTAAAAGVCTCCRTVISWHGIACWKACLALTKSRRGAECSTASGDAWQQACLANSGKPALSACSDWLQRRWRRCLPQARRRYQRWGSLLPGASPTPRLREEKHLSGRLRRAKTRGVSTLAVRDYASARRDTVLLIPARCGNRAESQLLQAADINHVLSVRVRPAPAEMAELTAPAQTWHRRAVDFGVLRMGWVPCPILWL